MRFICGSYDLPHIEPAASVAFTSAVLFSPVTRWSNCAGGKFPFDHKMMTKNIFFFFVLHFYKLFFVFFVFCCFFFSKIKCFVLFFL